VLNITRNTKKNGAKIVFLRKDCNALNFVPKKQEKGMITYFKKL
jgi:hypothetical protein